MRTLAFAALIGLAASFPNTTYGEGPGGTSNHSRVEQIQKGSTTKNNIIALFGEPGTKDLPANGDERWIYTYLKQISARSQSSSPRRHPTMLIITFDNKGFVKSVGNRTQ